MARGNQQGNRTPSDSDMAQVDGWTTYEPPPEKILAGQIAAALDAAVHDCRLFARLARQARMADLPSRLGLTWEQFCEERLRHPVPVVEAIVRGVEILGEEVPIPAAVAERIGSIGPPRRPTKAEVEARNPDDIRLTDYGTGRAYLLARLARDAKSSPRAAQLLSRVEAKKLSVYAAARQLGIIKTKTPLEQLRHWWAKASPQERQAFWAESTGATESTGTSVV
jgi:hypothetical protein